MLTKFCEKLIEKGIRKFVFLGGSGSGKSEFAVNIALELSGLTNKSIHFFDMDQTKPLFRTRDLTEEFKNNNIELHAGIGLLDAPIVPHGVEAILNDECKLSVLDIGGNDIGSFTLGRYQKFLDIDDTDVYYLFNYYRPFSDNLIDVEETIERISTAARVKDIKVIANPNIGFSTTVDDYNYGVEESEKLFRKFNYSIEAFGIHHKIFSEGANKKDDVVLPIKLYIGELMKLRK